ncbi:MAG: adenosylhomocysteinase [Olsenella sp.]|nr:adenosylhomocysteinase [Olsenella sp.]MCI1289470.1 adenosylhomocysteinase [Olsenella sp.]
MPGRRAAATPATERQTTATKGGATDTQDTFANWACAWAQATNSSLAGTSVHVGEKDLHADGGALALRMAEWGLVPTADPAARLRYPELPAREEPSAAEAWARAREGMPVSAALAKELAADGLLRGVRIAMSLIVEPKTAVLVERLAQAGATVGVYCHAHECHQYIADELASRGYAIEANSAWTPAQEREGALHLMDRIRPNVVIDDGANFARLLVMERPALLPHLIGVAEETTSGVRAFQAMQAARELPFPVVAVNDSQLKTRFDNRHGTGETCVATTLELLGASCLAGARVAVMGYGPVGEGFARRARALGARVTVVELDPVRALEARFAGFGVARAAEALPAASMVVSATGVRHTLPLDLLRNLPNGCRVVVIGGIANEVALDQVVAAGGAILPGEKDGISQLRVPQGPTLTLLAAGDGVNYAAGPGNPIEIMDLSFAVQILAVEHLLRNRNTLPNQVLRLGPDADRRIATLALAARGIALDTAPAAGTADGSAFVPDWRVTRFSDAVTTPAAAPASPNPKELP